LKKTEKTKKPKKKWGTMVPHMLKMFGKKADTNLYPAIQANVAERFRGMLAFDAGLCVGCKLCQKVCPTDAIKIEKIEGTEGTEEKRYIAVVQLDKCIFCGQCVDTCHKGALRNTSDFELACSDKNALTVKL
jgi:formate hydrogenlyase subunit 6/NADH:ubiquinone oxidoreductase subunit I